MENPVPVQKGKVLCGLFNIYKFYAGAAANSLHSSILPFRKARFYWVYLGLIPSGLGVFFPFPCKKARIFAVFI